MNFMEAMAAAWYGKRVARKWKRMWVDAQPTSRFANENVPWHKTRWNDGSVSEYRYNPPFRDIFASDWIIVESEEK